jgi:hypothetical protein
MVLLTLNGCPAAMRATVLRAIFPARVLGSLGTITASLKDATGPIFVLTMFITLSRTSSADLPTPAQINK